MPIADGRVHHGRTEGTGLRMGRKRLSVCTMTINSARTLGQWAETVRTYADEIIVGVDEASDDGTEEVARSVADAVFVVEHPPCAEYALDWLYRKATGDWILKLDDDEIMSEAFAASIEGLMGDTELTQYSFDTYWVVRRQDGTLGWLKQYPWYPDPHVRMFRNIGTLYWQPPQIHTETQILGGGRKLDESEGVHYHLGLAWRSREERESKVLAREDGQNAPYYLYEGLADPECIVPVTDPSAIRFAEVIRPGVPGRHRAAHAATTGTATAALDEMLRDARSHAHDITVGAVEFLEHDTPEELTADTGTVVWMGLRNTSEMTWAPGSAHGAINVSYHLWSDAGEKLVHEGLRSALPRPLRPGQVVRLPVRIHAPHRPGSYVVQWDLVQEGVGWFSDLGATSLKCGLIVLSGLDTEPAHTSSAAAVGPDVVPYGPLSAPPPERHRRIARALVGRFPFLRPYVMRIRAIWPSDRTRSSSTSR